MKLFLDDERTPEAAGVTLDWVRTYTPEATIELLKVPGLVDEISLDNDLGLPPDADGRPREGYAVFLWIEEQVATCSTYMPPVIRIHTSNTTEGDKMRRGLQSIERMMEMRQAPKPQPKILNHVAIDITCNSMTACGACGKYIDVDAPAVWIRGKDADTRLKLSVSRLYHKECFKSVEA